MKFRELPGFPLLFVDFVEGAGPVREFLPHRPDAGTLCARAALAQDPILSRQDLCDALTEQAELFGSGGPALSNIARLRAAGSVVVAATLRPGLLGGPLSSWLKAMTAARLAAWLTERGLPAIPIGWIDSRLEPADLSIGLLSPQGPRRVDLDGFPDSATGLPDSIRELLVRVAALAGPGAGETDILSFLESTHPPGAMPGLAWGRTISKMLEPCGIVLLDPYHSSLPNKEFDPSISPHATKLAALLAEQECRLKAAGYNAPADRSFVFGDRDPTKKHEMKAMAPFFVQSLFLPIAAFVIEESEVFAAACEQPIFSETRRHAPILWPRISATLVDERSRKLLARYDLGVERLYDGPQSLADGLMNTPSQSDPLARVDAMKAAVEGKMAELAGLVPPGDGLGSAINNSQRRMVYQMGKLAAAFSSAQQRRRQIVEKHAGYLCGHLAPWGRLQERELAGFQFILPYSVSLRQRLYQSIDLWKFEHQLIFL